MSRNPGFAIWLTGLPASGKTTLAQEVAKELALRDVPVHILDSDELRRVLTPEPTYSQEERAWFYRTMVYIGRLLTEHGINVFFAATANRRAYRDQARQRIERFVEIYVSCPLETCVGRDKKGIYAKAFAGKATTVPGVQAPYEPPENPGVVIDTGRLTPEEGGKKVLRCLSKLGLLNSL